MDRKAEDLVGLPQNDRQRHAVEKADQDRPREEVRQHAETQKACPDADEAGEQGQRRGQGGIEGRVTPRERGDGSGDHSAGCGVRPDDQLARGPKDRIGYEWQDG